MWLYVLLTGHITIRNILRKNQSMGSEPQNMVLVLDVITSKLARLMDKKFRQSTLQQGR